MNISFECPDKINGQMTVSIEKGDIENDIEKSLKQIRKTASMPGFRPGKVPMQIVRRRYEMSVKADTINKVMGKAVNDYLTENKIDMMGEPLPSETKQSEVDITGEGPYVFNFDIAVRPEVNIELGTDDTIDYYDIEATDEMVDNEIEVFAERNGHVEDADTCDIASRDLIYAKVVELGEDGQPKEGGVVAEESMVMPNLLTDEEQRKLFDGIKVGTSITVDPKKLYPGNENEQASFLKIEKEQLATIGDAFSLTVNRVSHFVKAPIDKKLFDEVFGEGAVADEAAFRARIKEIVVNSLKQRTMTKFSADVKAYATQKVGKLQFPENLIRRIIKANAKKGDAEMTDEQLAGELEMLSWDITRDKLAKAYGITVSEEEVMAASKAYVRAIMASYGMPNVPDDFVDKRATEQLKERRTAIMLAEHALESKLMQAISEKVTLNHKSISLDDFNKLETEKQ